MWKALDNLWLTRAGTAVFLAGAIQTLARWLMGLSLNVVGVVLFAVGIVLILGPRLSKHSKVAAFRPGTADTGRASAIDFAEMITEGRKLAGDEFGGNPSWGDYVAWRERIAEQVGGALGGVEKQRLLEVKPRQGSTPRDHVLAGVDWLKERRDHSPAQTASDNGEFGRRDDRGELAQRCHMLAGSVERWVESFRQGHSERAEKFVAEWLEAEPATDPAEARRKALTRDEKNWEADYRLKYQSEAAKRFEEAWELGEVAKEHEQLATAPLAIQFEEVPKLFNTIADRLYGDE
jgi:hypothetical protein